ncbi:MAG: helix-turn-helix domain-containing protein [Prevotella sp.]|nr:helix-turn-helix domain-containing protein [Prevotella sp.]
MHILIFIINSIIPLHNYAEIAEARKEKYLTREEVKQICGVCDATLWHWNKKNYLKTIKVGSKVRYRMSDVKRILEGNSANIK